MNGVIGGNGGAIFINNAHVTNSVIITDCIFYQNSQAAATGTTSQGYGGAIAVVGQRMPINETTTSIQMMQRQQLQQQIAMNNNGDAMDASHWNVQIVGCTFTKNSGTSLTIIVYAFMTPCSFALCD